MCKILLFGGTTEGRELSEFLVNNRIPSVVCAATTYGGSLSASSAEVRVLTERLDATEMEALMKTEQPELVIDATHPYAAEVTENIQQAAKKAGIEYLRVLRETEAAEVQDAESGESGNNPDVECPSSLRETGAKMHAAAAVYVDSVEAAAEWLDGREGQILVTTGSKEIQAYTKIRNWQERVFARVLSTEDSVHHCAALGFEGKNLIAMQGPFTEALNEAMLRAYDIRYLVTKDTGRSGGFAEKIEACQACGCTPVIIGRPCTETGISVTDCKQKVIEHLGLRPSVEITLIGIGPGGTGTMTEEGVKALQKAAFVIGSGRMLDCVRGKKPLLDEYRSAEIASFIDSHRGYERFAVLLSGDTGFYSGAKKLYQALNKLDTEDRVQILTGISSVSYFAARLGTSWDNAVIASNHGRTQTLIPLIRDHEKVFSILGKPEDVAELAQKLVGYGMAEVKLSVGERLSYADEKITVGTAKEFCDFRHDPLSVLFLENPWMQETKINPLHCRRDEEFLRGKVPMTKEEIRVLSVDRLHLNEEAVCYDIGAGTGSVSIEMALRASKGSVYAVERNPEAVKLLQDNRRKFKADNLTIVEGLAPEAMDELPPATHVFIGGSAGNMDAIVEAALAKLPENKEAASEKNASNLAGCGNHKPIQIRFVINCIALESTAQALACAKKYGREEPEVTQISVARGHAVGNYTMMKSENPITIICFDAENPINR